MSKHTCWDDLAANLESANGVTNLVYRDVDTPIGFRSGQTADPVLPIHYTYRRVGEKKLRKGFLIPPFCPLCGKQRDDGTGVPAKPKSRGAK